jgi:glycerophosphoryl diester phosphodiesterase
MTDSAVAGLRKRGGPCRIIAHRGYSAAYRENTPEAYDQAIQAGADVVEIDLRLSKDSVPVCQHDAEVDGIAAADMTSKQLEARGIWRLADVLPALRGRSMLLFDLKTVDTDLAGAALDALRVQEMVSQTVIGVRSVGQARFVRAESPDSVMLGFLKDTGVFPEFFAAGGDIARLWEDDCTAEAVSRARCGDHPVWITAGRMAQKDKPGDIDLPRLRRLFACGIDGVLVNDPVLAIHAREGEAA